MKYAFIAQESKSDISVRLMCNWLEVSPAGFYASLKRSLSERAKANASLKLEIKATYWANHRRYGALKIHRELKDHGIKCGHNRVARLMREEGLRSKRPRPFTVTTRSDHRESISPNLLERKFSVSDQRELNRVWVGDITYLSTREGWLYLSTVIDLSSRRVVGWNVSSQLDHELALKALIIALRTRMPSKGKLIYHSDRGVQYASNVYRSTLSSAGIESSMSNKGDCWDNAVAESFFATLKTELAADAQWETRSQAAREVAEYIDWYNQKRRHQTLGYLPPAKYELQLLKGLNAA